MNELFSVAHIVDIVRNPAHQLAMLPLRIELHRQRMELPEQIGAHGVDRLLRYADHPVVLQEESGRIEQVHDAEQDEEQQEVAAFLRLDIMVDRIPDQEGTEQAKPGRQQYHKENKGQQSRVAGHVTPYADQRA